MSVFDWLWGRLLPSALYRQSDTILAEHQMSQTHLEEIVRLDEMDKNRQAYAGLFQDPLLHDPADTSDTVRVNKIRPIIDISVDFLFAEPPKIEIPKKEEVTAGNASGDEGNVAGSNSEVSVLETKAEAWLSECLQNTDWHIFLQDSATNGGICGTAYAKFMPADPDLGEEYPHLQVLDPVAMRMIWDVRDISHITQYIWQYPATRKDPQSGKTRPVIIRQRSVENPDDRTWTIIDEWAEVSDTWSDPDLLTWQEDSRTDWPYDWSPVLHVKNLSSPNEVYGDSDLDMTVLEANDRINFLFSNWVRILKHHAHPKIYLQGNRGAAAELVKLGPKAIWDIPDPQAKVGQLAPAIDGSQTVQAIDEIEEEMQERTQTPALAIGMLPQGRDVDLSGVALRMKMMPLTLKTKRKRATYGAWIVEICRRLLEMGNFPADVKVKVVWPEILPIDPVSQRQVALMDAQLGVPEEVLQEQLGYNYENNHEQYLAEQKEKQDLGIMPPKGPNGQPPAAQMTPAGSQVKGPAASKNDTGPSMQKQQSPGMKGMPANNSRS